MTLKKKIQIVAIILLILAIPLSIPNTNWNSNYSILAFLALILGTIGSISSIFIPSRYTFKFQESHWIQQDNFFVLAIPFKQHGVSKSPKIEFQILQDGIYSSALTSSQIDNQGNITITVNSRRYNGQVIIT